MSPNERPFSCNICSKDFTRSENLNRHKRTRHGGETRRIYQCQHCHCRFSRKCISPHPLNCTAVPQLLPKSLIELVTKCPRADLVLDQRDVCKRHIERCSNPPRNQEPVEDETIPEMAPNDTCPPFNSPEAPPVATASAAGSTPSYHDDARSAAYDFLDSVTPPEDDFLTGTYVNAYFTYFHPSLPIIHRPTFWTTSPPKLLLDIVVAIGLLYSAETSGLGHRKAAYVQKSESLWRQGVDELNRRVTYDWRELRETWMMQSWLLHIVYGAFTEDVAQAERISKMLRILVDSVRDLGFLKQVVATLTGSPVWLQAGTQDPVASQPLDVSDQWRTYIGEESLKLCIYTVLLLDHHIFSCSNIRPLLSTMECLWELPLAASLWEAENAGIWYEIRCHNHGDSVPGTSQIGETPFKGFLSTATQSLLSEMPDPKLMTMLAASPFAMMCTLTNLDALVKDFTRCYYQLPPSPADPSAFHILTQSQTRQVCSALSVLFEVVNERLGAAILEPEQSVWHACQVLIWSIKLSLCRPDDLLVGGIVENRVFASLVTATHLTMGSYITFKRTTHATQQHRNSHDGMLAVIDDLTNALFTISTLTPQLAMRELPWITAASYRLLLTIWRTLRVAKADILEKLSKSDGMLSNRSSGSGFLIFHSIMETVAHSDRRRYEHHDHRTAARRRPLSFDADDIIAEGDTDLVELIQRICRARAVWMIGPSLANAMQDATASVAG